jgi:hypothetical protein
MAHNGHKNSKKGTQHTFAAKRTMNEGFTGSHQTNAGSNRSFQQQGSPRARRGAFEGRAHAPQSGNRHQ